MRRRLAIILALSAVLPACGSQPPDRSAPVLQVFAASSTATPEASPQATPAPVQPAPTARPPAPTPTLGAVAYTIDFSSERHDVLTLRVGQAIKLQLSSGPSSDWLSGVDDARVLAPM